MNRYLLFTMALLAASCTASAPIPQDQGNAVKTFPELTGLLTRGCVFAAGGWTIVNCSNVVAASSLTLHQWSRYVIQCGDDSYVSFSAIEDSTAADSSDGWLPSGAWLEFVTTDEIDSVSCLNKNVDSDCRLMECR